MSLRDWENLAHTACTLPNYCYSSSGILVPTGLDIDADGWGSFEESYGQEKGDSALFDALQMLSGVNGGTIADVITQSMPLHSFRPLTNGSKTRVFLAQSEDDVSVLRMAPYLSEDVIDLRDDCVRPKMPGLLQPKAPTINIENAFQVEVLHPVHIVQLDTTQARVFENYLDSVLQDTCYKTFHIGEAAVLPDGTLMVSDPGECPYKSDYWELSEQDKDSWESESVDMIFERQNDRSVPQQLKWFTADGQFKPDYYFKPSTPDSSLTSEI